MTMHAMVTDQGTAMSETALCGDCFTIPVARESAINSARSAEDWEGRFDGAKFHDASGNDELSCIECGISNTGSKED